MKKSEIIVGNYYTAKINNRVVTVHVDSISTSSKFQKTGYDGKSIYQKITLYHVTNTLTNRQTTFHSATKFREPVTKTNNLSDHYFDMQTRYKTYYLEFNKIFQKPLKPYWSNLLGFDVLGFDQFIAPEKTETTFEAIGRKYGDKAIELIEQLTKS